MESKLTSIMIYARDINKTAAFYQKFFGFKSSGPVEGLIELSHGEGDAKIFIHQAAKAVKLGQVGVKLVFAVRDVEEFKARSAELGLKFGATHKALGYSYANAKDPDKNSVSISSRTFRRHDYAQSPSSR